MHPSTVLLAAAAATAATASGQDFNLDLGSPNSPFGVPSSAYGGPAERPGTWQEVSADLTPNLVAIDGTVTPASLTIELAGVGYFYDKDVAGTTGDEEALLDDSHQNYPDATFRFQGLAPGHYRVYTIGIRLYGNAFRTDVYGVGTPQPMGHVGWYWPGSHALETTYFFHDFFVDGAGTLAVKAVSEEPLHDNAQVGGFQLVRVDEPGGGYCFGAWSCPCQNTIGDPEGCRNSTGSGGRLVGSGSTSVTLDDLRFSALGLPAKQFSILFVGPGPSFQVLGDGRLCVSGSLVRLGTKKASAGGQVFWGPGLQPTGGWAAGETRWFQAWFRDPGGPCGSGSNLTNGYVIRFTP